ncbi:copper chaperone [Saccharopolyspora erythraea NRRL 2338]|uniref:Heavy metal transport/detoxification protein n=2 Tax=Saccharopolyspora erythraea TaxID=1836 RepID=A4FP01_SACEN|nr:heavy-metal-associated domain-containing protein [Saccharopolyspora erythraea]EQD86540.1 copper chaperone [Saccharopolyspora erythraea D]PFG99417.1 copper chaperone [Saccharopolyspora erythraea NRRL 2338]QRK89329.1 heavy-metal-associated domain-containing protein [Saccharopolyspora erythraea]CAM05776.1 heavy metal transport/detoxification protein [Saccharopolyspora erythraea NRRL 2338]
MTTTTYTVKGMTCEHCAGSVRTGISGIAGVSGVDVDLATGTVTVTSAAPPAGSDVAAAVREAGYEVVSRP